MNLKTTISALSLVAASSASAFMQPAVEVKTVCLETYQINDGSPRVGTCDMTRHNEYYGREILDNGCAADQVAMVLRKATETDEFMPAISACIPPNAAQL